MPVVTEDEAKLRQILATTQTIAIVGHSPKSHRPSYQIAQFLRQVGYTVYAVNPGVAAIAGQPCYASLAQIPDRIDLVNVFRQSQYLPEIMAQAIALPAATVWAQVGIDHPLAIARAQTTPINLITNRCIMLEYRRLQVRGLTPD